MSSKLMKKFSDKHLRMNRRFKAGLRAELIRRESAATGQEYVGRPSRLWPVAIPATAVVLVAVFTVAGWPGHTEITLSQVVEAADNRLEYVDDQYNFAELEIKYRNTGLAYCENPLPEQKQQYTGEEYYYNDGETAFGMEIPYQGSNISMWYEDNIGSLPETASVPLEISEIKTHTGLGLTPMELLSSGEGGYVNESGTPIRSETELEPVSHKGREVYRLFAKSPAEHFPSPEGDDCESTEVVQELLIDSETYDIVSMRFYRNSVSASSLVEEASFAARYTNVSVSEALSTMEEAGFILEEAKANSKNN